VRVFIHMTDVSDATVKIGRSGKLGETYHISGYELVSIRTLVETLPEETTVYPGHMGVTTLGAERATNPFLAEFAR